MQQQHKELGRKTAATSEEREDIRHEVQECRRAGDRKTNRRVFHWATGSEWLDIVEGSTPSKTEEKTTKIQPS
jgi:hypothetical protein